MKNRQESVKNFLARGYSRSEAAREGGVSRQTVANWLKDEKFVESLRLEEQEIAREALKQRFSLEEESEDNRRKVEALESNLSPEFLREKELQTLNRLETYAEKQAIEGNLKAIGIILRISERRSKLLGIDRQIAPIFKAIGTLLREQLLGLVNTASINSNTASLAKPRQSYRAWRNFSSCVRIMTVNDLQTIFIDFTAVSAITDCFSLAL